MPKGIFILSLLLFPFILSAQNIIEWSNDYKLTLSDFRSPASEIGANIISIQSTASIGFAIQMSNLEFMATKNFNSKIKATFSREGASLISPDEATAQQLVKFAQCSFDLAELYSRKFRKRVYEEKKATSDIKIFNNIHREIQTEFEVRNNEIAKVSEMGLKESELIAAHAEVLKEIDELADYCMSCNPPKKLKKNKTQEE